ncbi:MAG: hypothetical protein OXF56_19355 [Rhodobacteraceae bacterium]|nr:hypothetical protein [Paracoccaceae bacterium]
MDSLLSRETLAGLVANDDGSESTGFLVARLPLGEVRNGLFLFGGDTTSTLFLVSGFSDGGVRDVRICWRLISTTPGNPGFETNIRE